MKVISAKNKNFDKLLDNLLSKRKNKLRSDYISVKNIIKDVRKNGDKALVKYEKRFNKNKTIIPNSKKIKDSIKSLDQKDNKLKLKLMGIDVMKIDKQYEINLLFSDNRFITLYSEIIEVTLEDLKKK